MTTTNTTTNTSSSNTAPVSASPNSTASSPSSLSDSMKKSGNALAGALWQAMSELAAACNLETLSFQQLSENGLSASYKMTETKAGADLTKSNDQANQLICDGVAKLSETMVLVGTTISGFKATKGPDAELGAIDQKLSEVKALRADVENSSRTLGAGRPAAVEMENPAQTQARNNRIDQLKRGENLVGRNKVQDKQYIDNTPEERNNLRDALKKQEKDLEASKSAYESQKSNILSQNKIYNDLATGVCETGTTGVKSGYQFDMGKQDYTSTEASNQQQQMAQSLGQIGSMSNKVADNEASIIQQYGQLIGNLGKPN